MICPAVLSMTSEDTCLTVSVTVAVAVTGEPLAGEPVAVTVLVTLPASRSAATRL